MLKRWKQRFDDFRTKPGVANVVIFCTLIGFGVGVIGPSLTFVYRLLACRHYYFLHPPTTSQTLSDPRTSFLIHKLLDGSYNPYNGKDIEGELPFILPAPKPKDGGTVENESQVRFITLGDFGEDNSTGIGVKIVATGRFEIMSRSLGHLSALAGSVFAPSPLSLSTLITLSLNHDRILNPNQNPFPHPQSRSESFDPPSYPPTHPPITPNPDSPSTTPLPPTVPLPKICSIPQIESITGVIASWHSTFMYLISLPALSFITQRNILVKKGRRWGLGMTCCGCAGMGIGVISAVSVTGPLSIPLLFLSAALAGMAGPTLLALSMRTYLVDIADEDKRTTYLSLVAGFEYGSMAAGMTFDGWFTNRTGVFLSSWYLFLVALALSFVYMVFFIPESLTPEKRAEILNSHKTTAVQKQRDDGEGIRDDDDDDGNSDDTISAASTVKPSESKHSEQFLFPFLRRSLKVLNRFNFISRLLVLLPKPSPPSDLDGGNSDAAWRSRFKGKRLSDWRLVLAAAAWWLNQLVIVFGGMDLLLLMSSNEFGLDQAQNGLLMAFALILKTIFLIVIFPVINRYGRAWYSRKLMKRNGEHQKQSLEERDREPRETELLLGSSYQNDIPARDSGYDSFTGNSDRDPGFLTARERSLSSVSAQTDTTIKPVRQSNGDDDTGSSPSPSASPPTSPPNSPRASNQFDVYLALASFMIDVVAFLGIGMSRNVTTLMVALSLMCLSSGAAPGIMAWMTETVEPSETDDLLGCLSILSSLFLLLSPLILGGIYAVTVARNHARVVWFICAGIMLFAGFILAFCREPRGRLKSINPWPVSKRSHVGVYSRGGKIMAGEGVVSGERGIAGSQ